MQGSRVLKSSTPLWITGRDGTSRSNIRGLLNSIQGGTRIEDIEVTLDEEHSKNLERKRLVVERITDLLRHMSPEQVEKVLGLIERDDSLMTIHEDYA
jgi:hypothetical protein